MVIISGVPIFRIFTVNTGNFLLELLQMVFFQALFAVIIQNWIIRTVLVPNTRGHNKLSTECVMLILYMYLYYCRNLKRH